MNEEDPLAEYGPVIHQPEIRRPTIPELERILQQEDDVAIEILPNGEVRAIGSNASGNKKPLTMREHLGGEYAA